MATLQAQDINDVLKSTLRKMKPPGFNLIADRLPSYEVVSKWMRKDRVLIDCGYGIQRTLMDTFDSSAAGHVGLFEEETVNVPDHLMQIQINWVHARSKFAVEHRELSMNRGDAFLTSILDPRRLNALYMLAEVLETGAWTLRTSTETELPNGIPMYVVYNANAGFNGKRATGHTTVAGVDPDVHTAYANYTDSYTTMSRDDGIYKMRECYMEIKFTPPFDAKQFRGPLGSRYRIYVAKATHLIMGDLVRSQNENIGVDLAEYDGAMVFHRVPVMWIPAIDENLASGSEPVYLIDHQSFYPVVLKDWLFKQVGPRDAAKQPTVSETFYYLTYNYLCLDRKRNALLAISDPAA